MYKSVYLGHRESIPFVLDRNYIREVQHCSSSIIKSQVQRSRASEWALKDSRAKKKKEGIYAIINLKICYIVDVMTFHYFCRHARCVFLLFK